MKRIGKVDLHLGRNAEHYDSHDVVLRIFTEPVAEELRIGALRASYAMLFARERAAFAKGTSFAQTDEVRRRARERNDLYMFVQRMVSTHRRSPEEAQRKAARELSVLMRSYRDVAHASQVEKTALLKKLVKTLREEDNAVRVETLGLTGAVDCLWEANQTFNNVYDSRAADRYARYSNGKMKALRLQVDEAYRTVTAVLEALHRANTLTGADVGHADLLEQLMDDINAYVGEFRRSLSLRRPGGTEKKTT